MKTSMFIRVCASLLIGAGVIFAANGETKTWTNATEDGKWLTAGNWNPSGVPASTDDIIIENGTADFVASTTDLAIAGSLTIGNGGTFVQSGVGKWIQLSGSVVVKSGGTFDMGTCPRVKAAATTASVTVEAGGALIKRVVSSQADQDGVGVTIKGEGSVYWATGVKKTWKGADGDTWQTASCWEPEGVPAAIDDVVIPDGMTCTYKPGGDFTMKGTLTLGKGAKWVQIDSGNWIQMYGKLIVGEGAQFDVGTADMKVVMNLYDGCSVHVCEGGWMNVRPLWGNGSWGTTTMQRVFVDGTIEYFGTSDLAQADFTKLSQTIFTYSETGQLKLSMQKAVQFAGTMEMDFAGTIELAGFAAQEKGSSGARENNVLELKRGKYIVRGDTGCSPRGILGWSPNDTDACKTWVDFPNGSKAEVVFTHTDITNNADVIADPYNVYTQIKDCIHVNNKVYNIIYCRGEQIQDLASFKKAFTVWQDTEGVHMKLKNPTGLVIRVQ